MLMSMEWARNNRTRGFIASRPQFGVPCGLFLANLAVLVFSQMSGEQFLAWGWRVPFLLSPILVAVGLYVRLKAVPRGLRDIPGARSKREVTLGFSQMGNRIIVLLRTEEPRVMRCGTETQHKSAGF